MRTGVKARLLRVTSEHVVGGDCACQMAEGACSAVGFRRMCLVPVRRGIGRVGAAGAWISGFTLLCLFWGSRACTWVQKSDIE